MGIYPAYKPPAYIGGYMAPGPMHAHMHRHIEEGTGAGVGRGMGGAWIDTPNMGPRRIGHTPEGPHRGPR